MRFRDTAVLAGLSIPILIGLALAGLGCRNLWRAIRSPSWPRVPAVVLKSGSASSTSRDSRTGAASTMYSADLSFGYRVGGRDYSTPTLHFGQTEGSGDSSEAELRRLRYPAGAQVSVSYDPADPSIAAVNPGFDPEVLWLPGAGLAFLLPGVMFIVLYRSFGGGGMALGLGMFATIFILIGLAMLGASAPRLWRGYRSTTWPATEGTVLYSRQDSSASVSAEEGGSFRRSTSYGTHLVYRFETGGAVRFSNVRRFGQISASSADWAEEIAKRYPPGAKVTVFYSPGNPEVAVLEPGISPESWWLPGAGAAFLLFGAAVWRWGIPALAGPLDGRSGRR
jgi:hypothetical protein